MTTTTATNETPATAPAAAPALPPPAGAPPPAAPPPGPPRQPPAPIGFGPRGLELRTFEDVYRFCSAAVRAGVFPGSKRNDEPFESAVAQQMMKVFYGAEIGLTPLASVQCIYIVEGKLSIAATTVNALLTQNPRVKFELKKVPRSQLGEPCPFAEETSDEEVEAWGKELVGLWTNTACVIEWWVDGVHKGESAFTIEEARTAGVAGKTVWKSYAKAMLHARALTQGARAYAPFVFNGAVYVPEELERTPETTANETDIIYDARGEAQNVGPAAQQNGGAKGGSATLKRAAEQAAVKQIEATAESTILDVVPPADASPEPVPVAAPAVAASSGGAGGASPMVAALEAIPTPEIVPAPAKQEPATPPPTEVVVDEAAQRLPPDDVPAVAPGEPTPPPPAEPAPAAKASPLLEALRSTPESTDPSVLSAHRDTWASKLDAAASASAKLWRRAAYNRARKVAETEGFDEQAVAELARLKALVAS